MPIQPFRVFGVQGLGVELQSSVFLNDRKNVIKNSKNYLKMIYEYLSWPV